MASTTVKRFLAGLLLIFVLASIPGVIFYWFLPKKSPPPGREIKDERTINIVEAIKNKASIHEKVKVFALPGSLSIGASIYRGEKADEVFIVTGEEQLEKWSDEALKGLFAHELAHLSLGHVDLVFQGKRDFEAEADAETIKLVGKDALRSCLRSYMEDRLDKAEKVLRKEGKR